MEEKEIDDFPFEVLIDSPKVITPYICCPSGNKVIKICSNSYCSVALQCSEFNCDHCGKNHQNCKSYSLDLITELYNNQIRLEAQLFQKVEQLDKKMIEALKSSHKELISQHSFNSFSISIQNIVNQIYQNQNFKGVSGADSKKIIERLFQIQESSQNRMIQMLKNYNKTLENSMQKVISLKKKLLSGPIFQTKIDSVIFKDTLKDKKNYEFLVEELKHPQDLILLYRGSENSFKAKAFHQKCGDKPNTLTIVRTEFGKTMAAFTPYKWHSVPDTSFVSNEAGGCFILSLENRDKLIPQETTQLIGNFPIYGPGFGINGYDLAICDECNKSRGSWAGQVRTYNTIDKKYKDDQATYTALSGATDGFNFLVLQYEVFEVIM